MPFIVLSIIIQVAFIIHIVKTGRNTTWIWIVLMLPVAGAIAYFIVEVLPSLGTTRTGRSVSRKIGEAVNPNKDIKQAAREYSRSDTIENSMRLAQECLNKGLHEDAKTLYQKCLKSAYIDDPHLLFGLAQADFALGNFDQVKTTLDTLIEKNPDYKNQDAHLLYARTLEALNEVSKALHEYETLHEYYAGPDASYYYGKFLKSQNQFDSANAVFERILDKARTSDNHYKSLHKEVLKKVRLELSS